jgi:hypothetical protein
MRIEIRYSVSEGSHFIEVNESQIEQMLQSDRLVAIQRTPKGTKSILIKGSPRELTAFAKVLLCQILNADIT